MAHGGRAPQVRKAANERLNDLIDPDRVLREAARLAYSDVTQLYDDNGRFLPMSKWPAHVRSAVSSVEVVKRNLASGDGHVDEVLKVRIWDKPKLIELLAKHLRLFEEQSRLSGELTIKWQE
jgi:phage terminase small subunit